MLPFDTSLAANVRMLIRATTSTLLVVTLMAGALLTGAKPAAAVDIKSVEAGVYRIIQRSAKGGGTGTGFLVGGKGKHVVTNNHVVEGDDDTEIFIAYRNANGSPEVVKARVVYKTAQQDLALIEADAVLPGAPFTLAEYEPEKLSEVYAVGFPGKADIVAGRGSGIDPRTLDPTMTTGSVSRVVMASNKDMKVSALTVQHSAAINPGNSGGPLFDGCGRVIGVNTFLPKDSQGIFFSIHSGEVVKMLRSQNSPPKTATGGCGSIQLMLSKGLTGTTALLSAFAATTIFSMAALVVALRTRPQLRQQLATRFSRVVGRPPDPTRYDPRAAQAGGLIVGGAGGRMAGGQAATSAMPQDLLLKGLDGRTHIMLARGSSTARVRVSAATPAPMSSSTATRSARPTPPSRGTRCSVRSASPISDRQTARRSMAAASTRASSRLATASGSAASSTTWHLVRWVAIARLPPPRSEWSAAPGLGYCPASTAAVHHPFSCAQTAIPMRPGRWAATATGPASFASTTHPSRRCTRSLFAPPTAVLPLPTSAPPTARKSTATASVPTRSRSVEPGRSR